MAGFLRRVGFFPGTELITQIEGVMIVDLPPPGSVQGVGVGTVALVGEFADVSFGVLVNTTTGVITTDPKPVEIFSAQDLVNKIGGWDETLGDFGRAMGNGFVELRNKRFSRLIVVPVNLASSAGLRLHRNLPTNASATDPTPVTLLQSGVVEPGREFRSGSNRVRVMKRAVFADTEAFVTGVDGVMAAAGAAATQPFDSTGSTFQTDGVVKGDVVTVGVLGTDDPLNTLTFRVSAVVTETQLTIERLDGVSFANAVETDLPFRVHKGNVADTGPINKFSEVGGYLIPARPLDATIAAGTLVIPTVIPPAATATTTDPLSGLGAAADPITGVVYDATVQVPNAANNANIDALYQTAVDSLISEDAPARDVNIMWTARKSNTIRTKLKTHVLEASEQGVGRIAVMSPELTNLTVASAIADAAPGVGANRNERIFYDWPGLLTSIPEAVNAVLNTADGATTEDGILDITSDGWLVSVLSNLPPERNPGQAGAPVPALMAPVLGFQRGVTGLGLKEYIQLRQKGICAPRIDRSVGPIFQSGITTSLTSGQKNINRRRFTDFLQDSLSQRYVQFTKLPLTSQLKDTITTETVAFLGELLSENNPAAQRLSAFEVDDVSGNTPELEARGIFVVIVRVRTLATADFIVLQSSVGESVTITEI